MFSSRNRITEESDVEIDMVPVMNMFLVLIPFLLISSSFLHLKAINTSVPVQSQSNNELVEDKKSEIKLTLMVTIKNEELSATVSADELTEKQINALAFSVKNEPKGDTNYAQFTSHLAELKSQYPLSDTLLLTPNDDIAYEKIINVMDAGRGTNDASLFPHVVLSGILK